MKPQNIGGFESIPTDLPAVEFGAYIRNETLLHNLTERGFTQTTPIQTATYGAIEAGKDVIACAQTGTGKTAAFLLPLMQRFIDQGPTDPEAPSSRLLVVTPTRELAVQIDGEIDAFGYGTVLSSVAVYGGVPMGPQEQGLKAPADIVVATPGRLLDHMRTQVPKFGGVQVLILDEADRMLDMGFWPDVRKIVASLPKDRQTLFFSATMTDEAFRLAREIMGTPTLVGVDRTGEVAQTISHHVKHVSGEDRAVWLGHYLRGTQRSTLVFVRTKITADRLTRRLVSAGVKATALHAGRTQEHRTRAVEGFRSGRYPVLVATDIAARGLDIMGIDQVVNYDVPDTADTYVHRVGRTGRKDLSGEALTLVASEHERLLDALERSLDIQFAELDGGRPARPARSTDNQPAETPGPSRARRRQPRRPRSASQRPRSS